MKCGFIGKLIVALMSCRAEVIFELLIFLFIGSSVVSDSSGTMKMITYGAKSDLGQDISMFCGKLIPTLERLELLSEVRYFLGLSFVA